MPTIIRDVNVQDAGDIRDIYGHYVRNGLYFFELSPPDEGEMKTRIERIKERGHPFLQLRRIADFPDTLTRPPTVSFRPMIIPSQI